MAAYPCPVELAGGLAIRGNNSCLCLTTNWQKNLGAEKWIREKLCSGISNSDVFAILFFCLPLGCGRRPYWAIRVSSVFHPWLIFDFRRAVLIRGFA